MGNVIDIIIAVFINQVIALAIIAVSYLIEKGTGLKLFIDHYTWVKSPENAKILSSGDSLYYFVLNCGLIFYYYYSDKLQFTFSVFSSG